jgi:hypothetical protein
LRLATSSGRALVVGALPTSSVSASGEQVPLPFQSVAAPARARLGFFKGWRRQDGTLAQIQLVWVRDSGCDAAPGTTQPVVIPDRANAKRTAAGSSAAADPAVAAMGTQALLAPVPIIMASSGDEGTSTQVDDVMAHLWVGDELDVLPSQPHSPAFESDNDTSAHANVEVLELGGAGHVGVGEGITDFVLAEDPISLDLHAQGGTADTHSTGAMRSCAPSGCPDGMCATTSCLIGGMGREVAGGDCTGLLVTREAQHVCANLACALDVPGCVSPGALGFGGFCSGRVVALGEAPVLHAAAAVLLGLPCIETKWLRSPGMADIAALAAADAGAGAYVKGAWKVCGCAGAAAVSAVVSAATKAAADVPFNAGSDLPDGGSSSSKQVTLTLPALDVPMPRASLGATVLDVALLLADMGSNLATAVNSDSSLAAAVSQLGSSSSHSDSGE